MSTILATILDVIEEDHERIDREVDCIVNLLRGLARDLDRGSLDMLCKTFTPDAVLKLPSHISGKDYIPTGIANEFMLLGMDRQWYNDLTIISVELTNDYEAKATSYVGAPLQPHTLWFDDYLVKLDVGWRIKERWVSKAPPGILPALSRRRV